MSKQIYVQAQADHIASLSKAAPVSAVEELIWNALDAEAKEVRVDLITNVLGAVEAVRIADDGSGIDVLRADSTFGSLGGSWKRSGTGTATLKRSLHGRHGRGRFKAFALGTHVEWRTTVKIGGELLSYNIWGDIENPGVFSLDSISASGPATGTEVFITNARVNCDSLLNAGETVQALAAKFALYLKSYPDVRIYFNGLPVTPVIVQKKVTDYKFMLPNGSEAKLELIEWKRKFSGSGRLVFAGPDGFRLHEIPAAVRSQGASFTAYLVSARFPQLAAENALVMDELNAEVRSYLDETKKILKKHFAQSGEDRAAALIGNLIREGSYPYDEADESKERERFDKMAIDLAHKMEGFTQLSSDDRAVMLKLLKYSVSSGAASLKSILA
ncbi:MAG: ATP-binding protein [Kiritimatiellae bacterium]|nr:ATP-binding protein [Kiritimatiellia bacterium]